MNERLQGRRGFLITWVCYTFVWVMSRWPALSVNALFFDDFEIPLRPTDFYLGPYRPTLNLNYLLWEAIFPGHFWTILPKIYGAIYIGLGAALFASLLAAWGVHRRVAGLLPLIVVAHPLLNDGPLWQTYTGLPLAGIFVTAGALAWTRGRRVVASILTLLGVFAYQIYIGLAVVFALAEWVIRRRFQWSEAIRRFAMIGATGVAQILLTIFVQRFIAASSDPRGFASSFDLLDRLHFLVDIIVNTWMPVLAYYAGALRAMSLWKFIPLLLAGGTAIATRRWIDTLFAAAIFVIPAAPNMLLSQNAYAWRVSAPEVWTFALSLVPLLRAIPVPAACAAIVACAAVLLPVSHYESWARRESYLRDRGFVEAARAHWNGGPFTLVLAPTNPTGAEDRALAGPHELTWGYERRTPRMWSMFNDPWMARAYVRNFQRLPFVDCLGSPDHPLCRDALTLCDRGCSAFPQAYPLAVNDAATRRTLACPGRAVPRCP